MINIIDLNERRRARQGISPEAYAKAMGRLIDEVLRDKLIVEITLATAASLAALDAQRENENG
jgi:hypothetical protein